MKRPIMQFFSFHPPTNTQRQCFTLKNINFKIMILCRPNEIFNFLYGRSEDRNSKLKSSKRVLELFLHELSSDCLSLFSILEL
jgi:hypothetical protein